MINRLKNYFDGIRTQNFISQENLEFLRVPFSYLINSSTLSLDTEDQELINKIEKIRKELAGLGKEAVEIFYSPKPNSAGSIADPDLRPMPGEIKHFDWQRIAFHTSISAFWGTFLYLLAKSSKAQNILELGSCAGISGCYLAGSPYCKTFNSIEASERLASVAQANISKLNPEGMVHNGLFDNVLDELLSDSKLKFDLIWIDGHHEKIATIHYFQRLIPYLNPGAIVLFDDISWSADMREGWDLLSHWEGFSYTFDLKTEKGMGIWKGSAAQPHNYFIGKPWGKIKTGNPSGWSN